MAVAGGRCGGGGWAVGSGGGGWAAANPGPLCVSSGIGCSMDVSRAAGRHVCVRLSHSWRAALNQRGLSRCLVWSSAMP